MSIGIGVVLEDGALLVSDGRKTRLLGDPSFKEDDDIKIDQVAPLVGPSASALWGRPKMPSRC